MYYLLCICICSHLVSFTSLMFNVMDMGQLTTSYSPWYRPVNRCHVLSSIWINRIKSINHQHVPSVFNLKLYNTLFLDISYI